MIYILYKEGYTPFKTEYWNAADIKIAQGWELIDSIDPVDIGESIIENLGERKEIISSSKKRGRPKVMKVEILSCEH